ncbi:MAG: oligosaccharide flippase family protein [Eubacteriales bacterium]
MNLLKYKQNPLIFGTIILTATGLLSRLIGFFYRIFISHAFGEESMGIYQLVGPVLALSFSFAAAGIQTAISKHVASEPTSKDYKSSLRFLLVGCLLAFILSTSYSLIIYFYSTPIATFFLKEPACAPLLRILAFSFPFSALHACINGYYFGIKKTALPALTGFTESICRTVTVFLLYEYALSHDIVPSISFAIVGIVIGEISSIIISLLAVMLRFIYLDKFVHFFDAAMFPQNSFYLTFKKIGTMALPLSSNRVILSILQSIEAIYIPYMLQRYGYSSEDALRIFGVLTGMALSLVLFPCALTNSASVLLLPIVSEAEMNQNHNKITRTIQGALKFSIGFGFFFTFIFFFLGPLAGTFLFHSELAGEFIVAFSFICPFLYISTTFSSILHGLGKTKITLFINITSLLIRIAFVFLCIPLVGIQGYFQGALIAQLFSCFCYIFSLRKYIVNKT